VLGCAVNGPGEAATPTSASPVDATSLRVRARRVLKKVSSDILIDELFSRSTSGSRRHACPRTEDGEPGRAAMAKHRLSRSIAA